MYRYERTLLTKQKRINMERRNAVEARELLKVEDVRARVLAIATELRRGYETIARAVDRAAGGESRRCACRVRGRVQNDANASSKRYAVRRDRPDADGECARRAGELTRRECALYRNLDSSTSLEVACPAVSPESRLLPASRNAFDQL